MYIADLHIHSRYSRATSRDCTPEYLDLWARRKGIHLVGTGDFTHRAWREELIEKLEPAEDGLYRLKEEYRIRDGITPDTLVPRFAVSGEISSIYKKYEKTRKVHSLILLPGLEEAEKLSAKLETIGNIHSDGRPILGLDCRDLLEIVLEECPRAIYVPAHIWTPHFSLFGAFSGFDTVEECFGDLSSHIHAMETGLSSDPPMNWRVSALDRYQLISNSDAHSPAKLGREANLLDIDLSYEGLYRAIQEGNGLLGTIEFFPEEGKYHYDGHRKCGICLSPIEAEAYQGLCPVCGRKLTTGVSHRIEQLADRAEGFVRENANEFESLVPLPEVIGASIGRSAASVKVTREYEAMLKKLGPEFEILRTVPPEEIQKASGTLIAEGIRRLREKRVERLPGFDGEYGKIRLFTPEELESPDGQMSFFGSLDLTENGTLKRSKAKGRDASIQDNPDICKVQGHGIEQESQKAQENQTVPSEQASGENPEQQEAIQALDRVLAVTAGPGTGKTYTLTAHILHLIRECGVKPAEITAVTFTNQAAAQMRERLEGQAGKRRSLKRIQIGTFHALCLNYLKEQGQEGILADEAVTLELAREAAEEAGLKQKPGRLLNLISRCKTSPEEHRPVLQEKERLAVEAYERRLTGAGLWDYDDLLVNTCRLLREGQPAEGSAYSYLLVDEFQDISPIQYELIKLWNRNGKQLFVIGDPDQAIYSFRGSSARCFSVLEAEFPQTKTISLTRNYRSDLEILKAAVHVISQNPGPERRLVPERKSGLPVRLITADSEAGEAAFLAAEISRQVGGVDMLQIHDHVGERAERSFGDIAVLYRTHRQAEAIEHCLKREGIPYVVAGRDSFLTEPPVRGTVCFFRYLQNPQDKLSEELCQRLLWKERSDFPQMEEKYRLLAEKKRPALILEQWIQDMSLQKEDAMKKLCDMAGRYKTMEELLNSLLLGVESDLQRSPNHRYTSDAVTLMTLHGAKGLEFPVVLLCGLKKGLLPLEVGAGQTDLEEERRLFYVGMTRAKEELLLVTSKEPSEFLQELPPSVLCQDAAAFRKQEETGVQMSLFDWIK